MTISVVSTAKAGLSGGTDVTLVLTDALEGDVALLIGGHGHAELSIDTPVGYTAIAVHTARPVCGAWYKVMGATPDATVTGDGGGNALDGAGYQVYVLRGVDAAVLDAAATSTGPTVGNNPNCPAITTANDDAWVFALGFGDTIDATTTPPAGYSAALNIGGNDTNDITAASAYLEITTAGVEDPGAWSTWGATNNYAITIAIRASTGSTRRRVHGSAELTRRHFGRPRSRKGVQ